MTEPQLQHRHCDATSHPRRRGCFGRCPLLLWGFRDGDGNDDGDDTTHVPVLLLLLLLLLLCKKGLPQPAVSADQPRIEARGRSQKGKDGICEATSNRAGAGWTHIEYDT